jgi:hypothetical protein
MILFAIYIWLAIFEPITLMFNAISHFENSFCVWAFEMMRDITKKMTNKP